MPLQVILLDETEFDTSLVGDEESSLNSAAALMVYNQVVPAADSVEYNGSERPSERVEAGVLPGPASFGVGRWVPVVYADRGLDHPKRTGAGFGRMTRRDELIVGAERPIVVISTWDGQQSAEQLKNLHVGNSKTLGE
ncbi:hypothetical protein BPOR_0092g00070 [Botrytis porri]|uniref:Uncharacterized protein n=1 Tax=Botrytis porri TaxID=87229 RepID=A0A4Z1KZA3_9HELO|nr:hypothetical protein BPOR_0092g00070 [Botrytis porri]